MQDCYHLNFIKNVPIGILTRNRPTYLDLTLRSLSACSLPHDVKVTIYDDASDLQAAMTYLFTSKKVNNVSLNIPDRVSNYVPNIPSTIDLYPINKCYNIVRNESHKGVFHASLQALSDLMDVSITEYVCLLQDDIILVKDWYKIMSELTEQFRPGILAGISFGCAASPCDDIEYTAVKVKWAQAQCLFIARAFLKRALPILKKEDSSIKCHFDVLLCDAANNHGFDILVTQPHVCQHVGAVSLAQPDKLFNRKGGRYSRYIHRPLVVAENIRSFL